MSTKNTGKVRLTVQVDRQLIPAHQANERYVLLALQAPDAPRQSDRLPLNLSLILDRSGSMSGDKLENVKEAAVHALRLLTEQDRVSVVTYDDEIEVLAPSRAVTGEGRAELIRRLREVRTGGMTNLSGGWFTGCDQIADFMTGDYLNRALLLTDGLANQGLTDQEQLLYEAKQLRRRGITTTTFGVGNDFNQFLLQGMADAGGGHFYFIDRPNQIPNYFKGELGELLSTVAREMTLEIEIPAGVTADLLNEAPCEQVGDKLRIFLGETFANEARTLVLKLYLPDRPVEADLRLPVRLQYEDARQRRHVEIAAEDIRFVAASASKCEKETANEQVLQEAARLEAEKAKMDALKKEHQGDIPGAQQALRRAGVMVAAMGVAAAPSLSAELHEMAADLKTGLTEAKRKQHHYATYLKQRSRKDYKG